MLRRMRVGFLGFCYAYFFSGSLWNLWCFFWHCVWDINCGRGLCFQSRWCKSVVLVTGGKILVGEFFYMVLISAPFPIYQNNFVIFCHRFCLLNLVCELCVKVKYPWVCLLFIDAVCLTHFTALLMLLVLCFLTLVSSFFPFVFSNGWWIIAVDRWSR